MKFKVLINGVGLKEVSANDIDGAYKAAVKEFGCTVDDILAVMPCVTLGEYRENVAKHRD